MIYRLGIKLDIDDTNLFYLIFWVQFYDKSCESGLKSLITDILVGQRRKIFNRLETAWDWHISEKSTKRKYGRVPEMALKSKEMLTREGICCIWYACYPEMAPKFEPFSFSLISARNINHVSKSWDGPLFLNPILAFGWKGWIASWEIKRKDAWTQT